MEFTEIQIFIKSHVTDLLSYFGALQGFILTVVVWNYPIAHKTSNRILAVFLFSLSHLLLAPRILEWVESDYIYLIYSIRFLTRISLLLYIVSLYREIEWKRQWGHLIIILFDSLFIYYRISVGQPVLVEGTVLDFLFVAWSHLVGTFYLILTYQAYQEYKRKVYRNYSSFNNLGVKWVYQIFIGMLALTIIDAVFLHISIFYTDFYRPYHGLVNTIAYTFFMYFVMVKGKLTPEIYSLRIIEELPVPVNEVIHKEEDEHLIMVADRVMNLMEKEKAYKEEGLSVKEVADKIGSKPYIVSQAINSCLEKNFFELVNGFRVEEAKLLMLDKSLNHLSFIGIAFEAGFSSKTAFNTAFKKYSGMSPSEFKKQQASAMENQH